MAWTHHQRIKAAVPDRYGRLAPKLVGILFALATIIALSIASPEVARAAQPIGLFTGVYGPVLVSHTDALVPAAVRPNDSVFFQDRIETQRAARMRALLDDDTVLTLGESSRLEITEHVYDAQAHTRSATLKLLRGTVRALVAKVFGRSKFEIHTPTAVVAARGTYFIVWLDSRGGTGVANIGTHSDVAFMAAGKQVIVRPGQYSTAAKDSGPSEPKNSKDNAAVQEAFAATTMTDNLGHETARETLLAVGGTVQTLGSLLVGASADGLLLSTTPSAVGSLLTPPAVVSGAIGSLNAPLNSALSPLSATTRLLSSTTTTLTTTTTTTVNPLLGPITTIVPLP